MNTTQHHEVPVQQKCCEDFCTSTFEMSGLQVENKYVCSAPQLSAADFWNITKNRRGFSRRTGIM